jgi:D-alanine-D-alanine ligase
MRRVRKTRAGQGYNVLNFPSKSSNITTASRGAADLAAASDELIPIPHVEALIERLLDKLRIAVVFAGNKTRDGAVIYPTFNTRSWKSYEAVANDIARALRRIGFKHVDLLADDMHAGEGLRRMGAQFAWLNTAGVQGQNPTSHAPAMMEMFGIPYVGHDPLTATLLDNKQWFKRELMGAGLATAPFVTWNLARGPFCPEMNSRFKRAFAGYDGPFVVKPAIGRASLHVEFVEDVEDLRDAVAQIFAATHCEVLVEAYLPGREFVVGVCGPTVAKAGRLYQRGGPFVFGAQERALAPGERIFTSMDFQPITRARIRQLDLSVDTAMRTQLHDLARNIYLEFNLSTLVRLDVRSDKKGNVHVLEANPKPDLKEPTETVTSLICEGLAEHGMSYDDLILSLIGDRFEAMAARQRGMYPHIEELLR